MIDDDEDAKSDLCSSNLHRIGLQNAPHELKLNCKQIILTIVL